MKKLYVILGMVALIGFCFTPVMAQDEINDDSAGTVAQVKWIGGLEFASAWNYAYLRVTENRELYCIWPGIGPFPNPDLSAAFHLPSGARLIRAQLYAWDSNNNNDVNVKLEIVRENWLTKGSQSLVTIETDTDDIGPQYTIAEGAVGHNIRNLNGWYHARVTLDNGNQGRSLRLWGVRLFYKLRIAPGPAIPTFSDVGIGNAFYDEIEAMAASGITTGYGDGTYGPDDNVTRGQMAAFFARALGLYWAASAGF